MKPSLPSYVCFMNIFNKYIEHTKSDYDSILHKIDTIVERIHRHFKYSDEQNLILEKNREKSKAIAGDHAAMTVKQIQTKKELMSDSKPAGGSNEASPRFWRFTLLFAPIRRNSNYEPGGFTGARSPAKSFR